MRKEIFLVFLSWRILLFVSLLLGTVFFKLQTGYLAGVGLFLPWANFDGLHYLSIAKNGYFQFEQAFFPLFPLLLKIGGFWGGLILNNLLFLAALFILSKLLMLDYHKKQSLWIILFLAFFPTSFFFGSLYTESLFLFLTVSSFYFARQNNYWLASILGMLASLTRFVGVLLFPALIVEIIRSKIKKSSLFFLLLIPLGTVLYMIWLTNNYGDPLYFIHAQPAFGANRSGDAVILLPQVFFRYFKILFNSDITYQYLVAIFELVTTAVFLTLSIISFRKLRLSYAIYSFFSLLLPTLTGTFSSMPRYILTIFPLFITLNFIVKKVIIKYFIIFSFGVLLVLFTALFTRGYWVS